MTSSDANSATRWGSRIANWLLACVLLLGAAFCGAGGRLLRISRTARSTVSSRAPLRRPRSTSTRNCIIRNFPGGLTTNFSFFTQPGQTDQRWVVIFDNVNWTGNMSCDAVHEHKIWLTNGSLEHASAQLPELPDPGREDRQVDPLRADHRHDRRAVHLPAHDPRAVRPGRQRGRRHHRQPGIAQRPARRHRLGQPQRDGRRPLLCEPRRLLGRERHAAHRGRGLHVHEQ